MCAYTAQGRDINLDINRVAGYRHFCNKIFNATKFALMTLGPNFKPSPTEPVLGSSAIENWILSRLNHAVKSIDEGWKKYDFSQVTTAIYSFWLYELCDVFLEIIKPIFKETGAEAKQQSVRETLYTCFDIGLRILHPFMPFITEEMWQRLPRRESLISESIMIAPYPLPVLFYFL